jgi:hypothetical protein
MSGSNSSGVNGIDLNMAYTGYGDVVSPFPMIDHYFILDLNFDVILHSWYPVMTTYASITEIEFGMYDTKTVPTSEIYTSESEAFNATILPLFLLNQTSISSYSINGNAVLIAVIPLILQLTQSNASEVQHVLSIGVVMYEDEVTSAARNISIFDSSLITIVVVLGCLLLLTFFIGAVVAY